MMVDSIPTSQSPPSKTIKPNMPSNSLRTSAALVGETLPNRLADGATTPPLNLRSNSCAIGCAGARMATVSCPPVRSLKTLLSFLKTKVKGPGQKVLTSNSASSDTSRTQGLNKAAQSIFATSYLSGAAR